jgi:hypothetical protein
MHVNPKTRRSKAAPEPSETRAGSRKGASKRVLGLDLAGGRERWLVAASGRVEIHTTSASSAAVMDRAVIKYQKALQRLANS